MIAAMFHVWMCCFSGFATLMIYTLIWGRSRL